jgi:hypothetical protein
MMRKQIIKDKFLTPIILSLLGCSGFISINNNWLWYFVAVFSFFILLSLFEYFKKEYYVKDYSIDKEDITFKYQINFSEQKVDELKIQNSSIKSLKFRSKSFLDPFYYLTVKYIDNENLYDKRSFKVLDKNQFTKIISHISNLESVNAII